VNALLLTPLTRCVGAFPSSGSFGDGQAPEHRGESGPHGVRHVERG
jgi:hypothetical protein